MTADRINIIWKSRICNAKISDIMQMFNYTRRQALDLYALAEKKYGKGMYKTKSRLEIVSQEYEAVARFKRPPAVYSNKSFHN